MSKIEERLARLERAIETPLERSARKAIAFQADRPRPQAPATPPPLPLPEAQARLRDAVLARKDFLYGWEQRRLAQEVSGYAERQPEYLPLQQAVQEAEYELHRSQNAMAAEARRLERDRG